MADEGGDILNYDNIKYWLEIGVDYVIPVVAVAVTYAFGRLQSRSSFKHQQLQKRYNRFYVPYISRIYQNHLWDISFQETSPDEIDEYFHLVFDNIQYLGSKTRSLLPEFYELFWQRFDNNNISKGFSLDAEKADKIFREFSRHAIFEALELSRSLRLPPLGQELLELFDFH